MSNILNVSSAIPGNEANVKNNPYTTADTNVQNPVNPSRVTRPDGKSDSGQEQNANLGLNAKSNYTNFIRMIQDTPQLTEVFTKLIFGGTANLVASGMNPAMAEQIKALFKNMKMTDGQALDFLKSQMDGATRFKGALFQVLRQVMNETGSVELRAGILDFVKKYGDMAAGKHLLKSMDTNLSEIRKYMFQSEGDKLEAMRQKLDLGAQPGNVKENGAILKREIIPLLSNYIGRTHDLGKIRDIINLFTNQVVRYENGDQEGLSQAFRKLMAFPAFAKQFQGVNQEQLMQILANTDFEKEAGRNEWADTFLNVIQSGMQGEGGFETRELFGHIVHALVLNESVFMPVLHLMLPMELNGVPMFSEIWVDPDDSGSGQQGEDGERRIRMLVKFDIKKIGLFDLLIAYSSSGKADVLLHYPEKLSPFEKEISNGVAGIFAKNQIDTQSFVLEKGNMKKNLSDIFPKLRERSNSINVRI